jgi:Asp-tRNA(Asn)/Glu-tRNA(Gln) amidotransferase A subunit family amidase
VLATIGTQTNGSIIRPAAYCGVVGYKPTVGTIPVAGVHPFAPTFDTVGTFARTVADAARVASALCDRGRIAPDVAMPSHRPRFAWLPKFPWVEPDYETLRLLAHALDALRDAAEIVPIAIPSAWKDAKATHRTLMLKEGSEVLGALQDRERHRLRPRSMRRSTTATRSRARRTATPSSRASAASRSSRAGSTNTTRCLRRRRRAPPLAASTRPATRRAARCGRSSDFRRSTSRPGSSTDCRSACSWPAPQGRDDSLLSAAAWCEERIAFRGLQAQ